MTKKSIDAVLWEKFKALLEWWKRLYTINSDDYILAIMIKVLIRIVGIVILIALSPFAILGVIIAFLFVG